MILNDADGSKIVQMAQQLMVQMAFKRSIWLWNGLDGIKRSQTCKLVSNIYTHMYIYMYMYPPVEIENSKAINLLNTNVKEAFCATCLIVVCQWQSTLKNGNFAAIQLQISCWMFTESLSLSADLLVAVYW